MSKKSFDRDETEELGRLLGIDWEVIPKKEFRMGLSVELEHGTRDPQTNVTDDDAVATARIALAHLKEFPDYYTRLAGMEAKANAYWSERA